MLQVEQPQTNCKPIGMAGRHVRTLPADVPPLLLAQAGPPAGETALGLRPRLAGDQAVPDRILAPLAENERYRELELAGGGGRDEVFRQGPKLHFRPCSPSITCSPQVSPASGADKVDRVGGRSLISGGCILSACSSGDI